MRPGPGGRYLARIVYSSIPQAVRLAQAVTRPGGGSREHGTHMGRAELHKLTWG